MSDRDEHEQHDEPLPVELATDEDLQRDFGSTPLLIGSPVTSKAQPDVLLQPNIPNRGQRIAAIEASLRRRKSGGKETDTDPDESRDTRASR